MQSVSSKLLQTIVDRLVMEFDPEQIILFGSHAWGTPTQDSDVDIMVIVRDSDLRPQQRATRAYQVLAGLRVPKDILVKTRTEFDRFRPVPASLEHRIAERGKVLYERSQAGTRAGVAD